MNINLSHVCELCGQTVSVNEMYAHYKNEHDISVKDDHRCSCSICSKEYSLKGIFIHYMNAHTNEGNARVKKAGEMSSIKSGKTRSKNVWQSKRNAIKDYHRNPRQCEQCEKNLPWIKREQRFCNSSCSATYNNSRRPKKSKQLKIKTDVIKSHTTRKRMYQSKISRLYSCGACGRLHQTHDKRQSCSCGLATKLQSFNGLKRYFGLNTDNIGTLRFIEDYHQCQTFIRHLYSENSLPSLCKIVGHKDAGGLGKILVTAGITLDTLSDAQRKSLMQGRSEVRSSVKFKCGWYKSKSGKSYYYRSSYELAFIEQLEINDIDFDMEIPFQYWDSQCMETRVALPDFIFDKKIVEIKSTYTYDEQNMKDKFLSYKNNGYSPILQLDFEYYELVNDTFIKKANNYSPF